MTDSGANSKAGSPRKESAPFCPPPDTELRPPNLSMPPLSCDCHAHICGPIAQFDYAADRIYTPPDALLADYLGLLNTLGLQRAVVVQPSVYGSDNTVMMAAMAEAESKGIACRGVAVVDAGVSDGELESMNDAGVRGLRFNLVDVADPAKGPPLESLAGLCRRVARLGWHGEFLIHVDDYPNLDEMFAAFPVPIVIGHMGYSRLEQDAASAGFQAMLRLAGAGKCWIKLTAPYRIAAGDLPYEKATGFAQAVIEAAPERTLWGTDWPHVMVTKAMPNDADLADLLAQWCPDGGARKRILVDNPAMLYGF